MVLYFVARNLEDGISISSVGRKLAGLAFWFKLRGEPDLTKDFWVRQAVKGYRKGRQVNDDRRPVSFELLGRICEKLKVVCASGYEVLLFRAAFVLAFFGAFRIGELVSPSKKGRRGLFVEEVTCLNDRVTMRVRRSKMDQDGKGKEVVVFAIPGCQLCPVLVLREFLDCRPALLGPLLLHKGGEFLSRFQFIGVFRKCLQALGLGGEKFSSHSFRIGAAMEVVRWGLDEELVKRIGRWESRRFRSYVRPELVVHQGWSGLWVTRMCAGELGGVMSGRKVRNWASQGGRLT
ncbi:integrase/recombinase xerD homolog [Lithobates pipiens]